MIKLSKSMVEISIEKTKKQNSLEDEIAMELFGCTWDELEYDDKELVTYEAMSRL